VKKDLGEKNNLVKKMPEKAKEMEKILTRYLKEVDGEDINEMYKARFEELDDFIERHKEDMKKWQDKLENAGTEDEKKKCRDQIERQQKNIERQKGQIIKTKENQKNTKWQ
jgi:hypothetical protein